MINGDFSFDLVDKKPPEVVAADCLKEISSSTKGLVKGNVEQYSGPVDLFIKSSAVSGMRSTLGKEGMEDIQDSLGAVSSVTNRFEVFLSVQGLQDYKYRMMFIQYKAIAYPAHIVLVNDLAIECKRIPSSFEINSMREMEKLMEDILNSVFMKGLIQSLINEALRQIRAG